MTSLFPYSTRLDGPTTCAERTRQIERANSYTVHVDVNGTEELKVKVNNILYSQFVHESILLQSKQIQYILYNVNGIYN